MVTAPTYADLRAMSDEELIALHDRLAASTIIGLGQVSDELRRREAARQTRTLNRLTLAIAFLTAANVVIAVVLAVQTIN